MDEGNLSVQYDDGVGRELPARQQPLSLQVRGEPGLKRAKAIK